MMAVLRTDFLLMLDVLTRCAETLKGKKIGGNLAWQADAEPIATKLFFHLGSLYHLQDGTSFTGAPGALFGSANYVDFPSIAVLARAAFETFLTFHFIFVEPKTQEEKQFRHTVWRIGGLRDRQRYFSFTKAGKSRQEQERAQIEELEAIIRNGSIFKDLDEPRKKDAIKGKWRFGKKWEDLAEMTGIHKNYFVSMYSYISSHAHTGYIGVLQLSQADDISIQRDLAGMYTYVGLMIMSHFVMCYCNIFPEAKALLDNNKDVRDFVNFYYLKAEDWDRYKDKR
jgi:hypothetical protein